MTPVDDSPLITPQSAERIAGMIRVAPARELADIVEHHWLVSWDRGSAPPMTRVVLADPSVNLAVEPAGILLYGVTSRTSRHVLRGAGLVIGTKFWPGGFSGYLPLPVRELNDRVVPVTEAFGPDGRQLARELGAATSSWEAIGTITTFLRARRPLADARRALVRKIVDAMRAAPPGTSVSEIADEFAVAPRTLQRLFAAHAGAAPKLVLQRFRLQQATDRLSSEGARPLARLAAELGYFDQAHFTQDFKAATGQLPSATGPRRG